jgi:hypothetical protein
VVQRWDVFISYAHEDEAWVRVLAENLHRAGRDVFFDQWEVVWGEAAVAAVAGRSGVVAGRGAGGKPGRSGQAVVGGGVRGGHGGGGGRGPAADTGAAG